jgi:hypothetical protein
MHEEAPMVLERGKYTPSWKRPTRSSRVCKWSFAAHAGSRLCDVSSEQSMSVSKEWMIKKISHERSN